MKQVRHVRAIIALPFLVVVVFPTLLVWQTGGPNAVWGYSRPLDLIITIVGALLIIDGLFVLGSMLILIFATAFVLIHLFYIPLSEERGLEKRFGEEFRTYKKNVPRWIPRLTAWDRK